LNVLDGAFVDPLKVYKFDGGTTEIVYVCISLEPHPSVLTFYRTAYASFGGLLMSLTGSHRHMTSIVLGDPVYVLLRK
jgi:DNA-directed RNA polymerase I, II, and III subunit RPABC3